MRINRLCATWDYQHFGNAMMKKYNLQHYRHGTDRKEPVVFFGCYGEGVKRWVMTQQGLVVIVWSGSDSTRLHEIPEFVQFLKENEHRVFHIAHSHWIQTDLTYWGIKYIDRVVLPLDLSEFTFCNRQGRNVYHYGAGGHRLFYYGTHLMKKLRQDWDKRRDMPHIEITAHGAYTKDQIKQIYADSFIGVRLTEHDNMALSCIELGLMGRPSIFNGNIPCAIPYTKRYYTTYDTGTRTAWVYQDETLLPKVAEMILEMRDQPPSKELAEEMRDFVHDDEKWLDTEFYV